jgi:catechol 2,3-dioxygenase
MGFQDNFDPGPQIAYLGGINLGTTNLNRSLWFFRDILGMEVVDEAGGEAYLRCYQELTHHSLVLRQQDESIVNSYSLRVRRPQDVEFFADELRRQDIDVLDIPAETELGRGAAIRFLIPGSLHPFELFYDISRPMAPEELRSKLPSNSSRRRGLGVRRLDHYNIQAHPDHINEAEAFFRETLGFKRREFIYSTDSPGRVQASWMAVTSLVHDIGLLANRSDLNTRLHHVAFAIENYSDSLTAADVLADLDVKIGVGPGKHGIAQSMYLYVFDPGSGHRIELYSGGYHIYEPDFESIEWDATNFPTGMTWYGDRIDLSPGSEGRMTTGSAGLHLPTRVAA